MSLGSIVEGQTFYYESGAFKFKNTVLESTAGEKSFYETSTYRSVWGDVAVKNNWSVVVGYMRKELWIHYRNTNIGAGFGTSNMEAQNFIGGVEYDLQLWKSKFHFQAQFLLNFSKNKAIRRLKSSDAFNQYEIRYDAVQYPEWRIYPMPKLKFTWNPLKRVHFYAQASYIFGNSQIQTWDIDFYQDGILEDETFVKTDGTTFMYSLGGGLYFGK